MKIHELKTWPEPWWAVYYGAKRHEWRKDDRGFAVGDVLVLIPVEGEAPHAPIPRPPLSVVVTYITRGPAFGVPAGYVCMSIARAEEGSRR